jgi:uncharacterized protein GlcG (DUF336 family)
MLRTAYRRGSCALLWLLALGFTAISGGVPIRVGDDVIGGVGVSESLGVDEPCVMAGIDRVREQLQ